MSDEQDKLKLSLEPPKLFGRKKKSDGAGTTKSTSSAPAARRRPASEPSEASEPVEPVEPVGSEPGLTPAEEPAPEPVADATEQPAGARMTEAIYPLHIGSVGGPLVKWLTALSGLVPAFLLATGFLFWRRRRGKR